MYFESHAHYDDKKFDKDRDELLNMLPQKGIEYVVNIGAGMPSTQGSIDLAEKYPYIYVAVGVHPHEAESMTEAALMKLEAYCSLEKVVAVGEIGLDFYYDHSPRDVQRYWFKKQLELAEKTRLPVVIHSRDASAETFDIIKESGVRKGVVHCYSGGWQMAMDYVEMGFYIGVGGVVTFSNARKLVEAVEALPMEKILIETDCPYLAPVPNRGQRNSSLNLPYITERIADIKKITLEEAAKITMENGKKLFSIGLK